MTTLAYIAWMMPRLVSFGHGSAAIESRPCLSGWWVGSDNMPSIKCASTSCVDIEASRILLDAPLVSAARPWNVVRLLAVVLGAVSLAACAQSSVVGRNSEWVGAGRQASLELHRTPSLVTDRHAAVTRKHTPFASSTNSAATRLASQGVASFYTEGTRTASGERFDTHELTAAHPSLPFGTRLRVTNVATGRSVTVRVNDRGPFVRGRVVDLSYAAAERLGMVGRGTAKVKLNVVE
jgi:rare lipoprotein A